jgi:hypothetical protein
MEEYTNIIVSHDTGVSAVTVTLNVRDELVLEITPYDGSEEVQADIDHKLKEWCDARYLTRIEGISPLITYKPDVERIVKRLRGIFPNGRIYLGVGRSWMICRGGMGVGPLRAYLSGKSYKNVGDPVEKADPIFLMEEVFKLDQLASTLAGVLYECEKLDGVEGNVLDAATAVVYAQGMRITLEVDPSQIGRYFEPDEVFVNVTYDGVTVSVPVLQAERIVALALKVREEAWE